MTAVSTTSASLRYLLSGLLVGMVSAGTLAATEVAAVEVAIVVGPDAPDLEQCAAGELTTLLAHLFDVRSIVRDHAPEAEQPTIYLGSPATNPAIGALRGDGWPRLSAQGIAIVSVPEQPTSTLVVGGGSPVATLWAVYEFGYHFGARYFLDGDVYPEHQALDLEGLSVEREPQLATRAWQALSPGPTGTVAWSLADQRRLIRQLAKLGLNHLLVTVETGQPFIQYEYRGATGATAALWPGETYPIPRDAPGRTAFAGQSPFGNPDFTAANTDQARRAAGEQLVQGLIEEAHRWGMTVGISLAPLRIPPEFAELLRGSSSSAGLDDRVFVPSREQPVDDALLLELVTTEIRACLDTYPAVDSIHLRFPDQRAGPVAAGTSWERVRRRLDQPPALAALEEKARTRATAPAGEQGVDSLRSSLVSLAFLDALCAQAELTTLLGRNSRDAARLMIEAVDPVLDPYLPQLLPPGIESLCLAQGGGSALVRTRLTRWEDFMRTVAARPVEGLTVALPTSGMPEPEIVFLARAAWSPQLSLRALHDELFTPLVGKQSAAERLWLAIEHYGLATQLIERHDPEFAVPRREMLMQHYVAAEAPAWWAELAEQCNQATVELYRCHSTADPPALPLLFYWAKRSEFVVEYLAALSALRDAAIALDAGEEDAGSEQLEIALEQMYNALDTLGDVAPIQSDRGLIAQLNAYAYRPLLAEYERVVEAGE